MYRILALLLLASLIGGCTMTPLPQKPAGEDTLYFNGHVYTGNPEAPWATAFATRNGKFVRVGSDSDVLSHADDSTQRVDLDGQTVVPGLYDSHIHPISGGEEQLFTCNFPQTATLDEILSTVKRFAKSAPAGSWITGGRWSAGLLDELRKEKLDAVSNNHPVVLFDFSNHNIWANTAAITAAGVTEAEAGPLGDRVLRTADGQMTGVFVEEAANLVTANIPPRSESERDRALQAALSELNRFGVIGIKDSYAGKPELAAYNRFDRDGRLTAHVATTIGWDNGPEGETLAERKERMQETRALASPHVRTDFAKISLDGIPPTKTAAFLAPYNPASEGNTGTLTMPESDFIRDVIWLDGEGFSVKVHAVGDRAARISLDAFEAARLHNGAGRRHEVAHACIVDEADIDRFAALDAIPDLSPAFWFPGPIFDGMIALLGKERTDNYCPVADYLESGSFPTYGTDWPVASTVNPWVAIEALVTRKNPLDDSRSDMAAPSQRISLEQALSLATLNGARAQGIEGESGSIEVGKTADFLILDRNIFHVAPESIGDTRVRTTVFEGRVVFQR